MRHEQASGGCRVAWSLSKAARLLALLPLLACVPRYQVQTWDQTMLIEYDLCYVVDDIFISAQHDAYCPPRTEVTAEIDTFYRLAVTSEGTLGTPIVTFTAHQFYETGTFTNGITDGQRIFVRNYAFWQRTFKHELAHVWLEKQGVCGGDQHHRCTNLWNKIDPSIPKATW